MMSMRKTTSQLSFVDLIRAIDTPDGAVPEIAQIVIDRLRSDYNADFMDLYNPSEVKPEDYEKNLSTLYGANISEPTTDEIKTYRRDSAIRAISGLVVDLIYELNREAEHLRQKTWHDDDIDLLIDRIEMLKLLGYKFCKF